MPIYTYQCPSCSNKFELRQGWEAATVAPCPICQTEAKRLLVVPSVIFKGKGWYSTDSKRSSRSGMVGSGSDGDGGGEGGGSEGGNQGTSESGGEGSSETKTAQATPAATAAPVAPKAAD